MKLYRHLFIALGLLTLFMGCEKPETEVEEEESKIFDYLLELCEDTTIVQPDSTCYDSTQNCICWLSYYDTLRSGLFYRVIEPGTGDQPLLTDSVQWSFTAVEISSGDTVDTADSIWMALSTAIQGLQISLPRFSAGSEGSLLMTSLWAYGERSFGQLGANQPLRVDFELFDVCSENCAD